MYLRNGRHIDRRVKDSQGNHGFIFWVETSFDPAMFLVRGDNFEDAYDWFLCDPFVENQLKIEDYFEDYIKGWDRKWVYGQGNTNKATRENLEEAFADGKTWLSMNDNGVLLDAERVNGMTLEKFREQR